MLIGNVHSAMQGAYSSQSRAKVMEPAPRAQGDNAQRADSVTISDTARQAASAEGVIPAAQTGAHSLEMYQVPGWRAEYMFQVPGKLGVGANWFAERYPQAASTSVAERSEYAELVQGHYQAVLEANGIQGVEAHYQATILDQDFSESLRQQMNERMQKDDRLLELMARMGKSISSTASHDSTSFSSTLAAVTAETSADKQANFTSMTRQDMFDWMNEQIRNGKMSLDESSPFLGMTMKISVATGQTVDMATDMTRIDFIEKARLGIEGALSRNDLDSARKLQVAMDMMQSREAVGG